MVDLLLLGVKIYTVQKGEISLQLVISFSGGKEIVMHQHSSLRGTGDREVRLGTVS